MADRIQQRRDTAARWAQYNPVLLEGEVGYVTDNPNQYKIGDGIHAWNDLPLRGFNGTIVQDLGNDENTVMSQKSVTKSIKNITNFILDFENGTFLTSEGVEFDDENYNAIVRTRNFIKNDGGVILINGDYRVLVYYYNYDGKLLYCEPNGTEHSKTFYLSKQYPFFKLLVFKNDYPNTPVDSLEVKNNIFYINEINKNTQEILILEYDFIDYGLNSNGIVESAPNYKITKPIFLNKGSKINIYFAGFNLGVMCLTDGEHSVYKPIYAINSDGDATTYRIIEAYVPMDGYYAFSGKDLVILKDKDLSNYYKDESILIDSNSSDIIKGVGIFNGQLIPALDYNYSFPFFLKNGDAVDIFCEGWDISLISKFDNGQLVPIVNIEGEKENVKAIRHVIEDSGFYVFSWRYIEGYDEKPLFKVIRNEVNKTLIENLGGLQTSLKFESGSIDNQGQDSASYPHGAIIRNVGYFVPFDGIISSTYEDVRITIYYCDNDKKVRRIIEYKNGVPLPQMLDTSFPYARIILYKKDLSILPDDFISSIKYSGNGIATHIINSMNGGNHNLRTSPLYEQGGIAIVRLPIGNSSAFTKVLDKGVNFFGYNENQLYTPASITKVMSSIVACNYIKSPTKLINIKATDITPGSGSNLRSGDILKFSDLLYDVFLPSSNTAAKAMARTVGEIILTEEGEEVSDKAAVSRFVEEMNNFANDIGMDTAHFDEPAGYPTTSTHLMSSLDALKMCMYAFSIPFINKTWNTRSKTINIEGNNSRTIQLVHDVSEYYIDILGTENLILIASKPGQIIADNFTDNGGSVTTNTLVGIIHSIHSGFDYAFAVMNTLNNAYKQFESIERAINYLDL